MASGQENGGRTVKTRLVARQLGWVLLVIDAVVIIAAIALLVQVGKPAQRGSLVSTFATELAFIAFPMVGALIVFRRPGNTVGWIFCAIGLGTAWTSFSAGFVIHALVTHTDTSVLVGLVDMLGNAVWPMNLGLGVLLLYLFPTGRLLSPGWRYAFWLTVVLLVAEVLVSTFMPGPFEAGNRVPNPLGIAGAAAVLHAVDTIVHTAFIFLAVGAVVSIVVRFVKSRNAQRQQIKWFAVGVVAMALIIAVSVMLTPEQSDLSNIAFAIGFAMIPIGAGIGVLRYRLFDIDVIINRTLVYGSLTAVLVGVYFAGVVGAQDLLNLVTGRALALSGKQGQLSQQSPVLIVVTTLLVAALFQPLRRRIQQFIDRRFYRSRYDTRKTLDKFGASLRSEVELAQLTNHLLETVEQTMHPAHISLWLRAPESER